MLVSAQNIKNMVQHVAHRLNEVQNLTGGPVHYCLNIKKKCTKLNPKIIKDNLAHLMSTITDNHFFTIPRTTVWQAGLESPLG